MTTLEKIEKYAEEGFQITIEISGASYIKHMKSSYMGDPENHGTHYVNLFYGDSNGPHKPGTKSGIGYGFSVEQAFNDAENNLKLINGK